MSDAANIQIKINTSDVEKAERLLAALENRSDKLYQSLSNLNKGTSFDKINNAVKGTDTTFGKLSTSMGQVQIKSSSTAQSIGKMTGQFAANDTAIQKAANSSNRYKTELTETGSALGVLGNKSSAASAGITKIGASSDKVTSALKKTSTATDKLRDSNGRFVAGLSSTEKALKKTTTSLGKTGIGAGIFSRTLIDMKGVLAGFGLIQFARNAIGVGVAFDTSLNNVQAKLGVTKQAMAGLETQAADLGATTAFSASQAADGMGFLAQAGLNAEQIFVAMPTTLNLASAAVISVAQSADIATNVMGAFGLSVADLPAIADTLAATSSQSNTSVTEMAMAIKQAGPVAAGFGVSLEEVSAAIGIMANNGIKGEQAGMSLKNMFLNLATPVGEAEKALDELGISQADLFKQMDDGSLKFLGMSNMMEVLEDSGAQATDVLRIFGREAGPAMVGLLETGRGAIEDLEKGIQSTGQAAEMAETQMQGLPGALKSMSSAWEGLNIAIMQGAGSSLTETLFNGITAGLRSLIGWVNDAGTAWTYFKEDLIINDTATAQFLNSIADAIDRVGDYVKPVIPYLEKLGLAITGFVAGKAGVALTAGALVLVGKAVKGIGVALKANPIGLAITAIAFAAQIIYDNWEPISKWWVDLWSGIMFHVEGALRFMNDLFPNYMTLMRGVFEAGMKLLQGDFEGAWESIKATMSEWGAGIAQSLANVGDSFKTIGLNIIEGLVEGIENGRQWLVDKVTEIGEGLPLIVRKILGIASPSKVFIEIGEFVGQGLAIGIQNGTVEVAKTATALSKEAVKAFDDIMQGLAEERIELELGADALRYHELAQKKLTDEKIKAVIAEENAIDALRLSQRVTAQVARELDDLTEAQELQTIELTQGAKAADKARYMLGGYTEAQAENRVATESNMKMQREFSDALVDSIVNASSVKDAFQDMGQWMLDWLKQKIAEFAAQKIMMFIGADVSGAMSAISGLFSSAGSGGSVVAGASGAANGAHAGSTLAGAGGATIGTMAAVGAAGYLHYSVVEKFADDLGAANSSAVAIGSLLGGSFGAAAATAFGSGKYTTGQGYEVGYSGGEVSGQNYEDRERKKSLWRGTDRWTNYSELDADVERGLNQFFEDMVSTIETQAGLFGVQASQTLLDNFTVDFEKLGTEEELQAWLEESTRSAYQRSFANLGPEMQAIFDGAFDLDLDPMEEISEKLQEFANTIATMQPLFNFANFDMSGNAAASVTANPNYQIPEQRAQVLAADQLAAASDAAAAATIGLTEALGGTEAATSIMQFYLSNFFTEVEQQAMAVSAAETNLATMNAELGLTGSAMITTKDGLTAYLSTLDMTIPAHQELAATALQGAQSLVILDQAMRQSEAATATMGDFAKLLGTNFDAASPAAQQFSDKLVELMGGFDNFSSEMGGLMEGIFSPDELKQLDLSANVQGVMELNAALGLQGDAMIQNSDGLRSYVDGLILQYGSLEAIPPAIMSTILAYDQNVFALEEMEHTIGTALDSLPEHLHPVVEVVDQFGHSLAGTGDATSLALAQMSASMGLTGDAAIQTEAGLLTYMQSLDLTTGSGIAAAMAVGQAAIAFDLAGAVASDTLAETGANIEESATDTAAATDTVIGALDANGQALDALAAATETATGDIGTAVANTEVDLGLLGDTVEGAGVLVGAAAVEIDASTVAAAASMDALGVSIEEGVAGTDDAATIAETAMGAYNDALLSTDQSIADSELAMQAYMASVEAGSSSLGDSAVLVEASALDTEGAMLGMIASMEDGAAGLDLVAVDAAGTFGDYTELMDAAGTATTQYALLMTTANDLVIESSEKVVEGLELMGQSLAEYSELQLDRIEQESLLTVAMTASLEAYMLINAELVIYNESILLQTENTERLNELLTTINEQYLALNESLTLYSEIVAAQIETQLLINESMTVYGELQTARIEQETLLLELMTQLGELRTVQIEQETVLGELMTARAELVLAQIEGYTLLNELITVFNELMLATNEQYTLINESLTLHDELIIKQVETYTLLNEALTVFEEGQLRRIEHNTLLNEQMVVQEELTLRKMEHYGAINVSMTLQEELTLRQIENYILLNEQRLAYLETASVLIETQSVMNEGLALFTETLTLSAEQITTGSTLMTESLVLLGETMTLSTTQVIEANALTAESYMLLVAANQAMVESQVIYGQTMTDTTAIVAASNVTMGESMTVMGVTIITAAGTVDTATIAANNSMNLMSITMTDGAGDIDTAAGTAKTAMDAFGQAMKDVATAASTAAGIAKAGAISAGISADASARSAISAASGADSVASSVRDASDSAGKIANALASASNSAFKIDGSHAGGLDYVPFNGYLGRLHEGEGVLTKAENAEYRKGDRVAPVSSVRSSSNDNSELRAIRRELQESRKEQELTRKEMAAMRKENNQLLAAIASGTNQQTGVLKGLERANDQLGRRMAVAQR